MKGKFVFLLIIIICIAIGLYFGGIAKKTVVEKKIARIPTTTAVPTPISSIGLPQRLIIPSLGVDAEVESIGLDEERRMDVPKNVYNTAWYNLGPKPGEQGNAAIDGHFDTPTGAPSVFYKLKTMKKGDLITVIDNNGKKINFNVVDVVAESRENFPLEKVFGKTEKFRLNLITCGGIWDALKKEYPERIVVYSEKIDSS